MSSFDELARAYEGLELPESFEDRAALARYREAMLERSREQAGFLVERLPDRGSVLEVACGNGRLLVELGRRGALGAGFGVDIARSRIDFARTWAHDAGLDQLQFAAGDVFELDTGSRRWDAAICITGAFAYFEPLRTGAGRELLERLHEALAVGALLVLELYQHPRELRLLDAAAGELRLWRELPEEDPWRFYLSRFTVDERRVLTHEKTFVHRTTGEVDAGRVERLRIYDPSEVARLLDNAGFGEVALYEGWSGDRYRDGEVLVVTARAA